MTNSEGSFNTIPAEAFSPFKVEIVDAAEAAGTTGGVRLRNMKGEFLSENLDWNKIATTEQIFTVEKQGQFQAFRSPAGKYLSLKDDGSLELKRVAPEGEIIERGKLIDRFSTWGPGYKISFYLSIQSFGPSEWSSVLSFKGNDAASNCCNPGDRVPSIFLHLSGRLQFSQINKFGNDVFYGNVQLNKWHKIDIEQRKFEGKVIYFLPSQRNK